MKNEKFVYTQVYKWVFNITGMGWNMEITYRTNF